MEDKHFDKIFWFVCGLCFFVLVIDMLVIFIPVPPAGQQNAQLLLGGLNTGAFMSAVQYLLGGNPNKKTDTAITGDKTVINNTPTNN